MNPVAIIATIKINVLRRPLWQADTVQECLDIKRIDLMRKIESGEIRWVWNIGQGNSRKELRILGHCIVELQTGPIAGIGATRSLGLPDVINLILPQTRQKFRGTELQRLLFCYPDTIRQLHRSGDLEMIAENRPSGGPNSSPHYTRKSVVKLLETRLVI